MWLEHQTNCASLADACLSLLEGSCIHIRMYAGACAHCGCDGVFSLCVFSCPQTLLASVEKELTFEELYLCNCTWHCYGQGEEETGNCGSE